MIMKAYWRGITTSSRREAGCILPGVDWRPTQAPGRVICGQPAAAGDGNVPTTFQTTPTQCQSAGNDVGRR